MKEVMMGVDFAGTIAPAPAKNPPATAPLRAELFARSAYRCEFKRRTQIIDRLSLLPEARVQFTPRTASTLFTTANLKPVAGVSASVDRENSRVEVYGTSAADRNALEAMRTVFNGTYAAGSSAMSGRAVYSFTSVKTAPTGIDVEALRTTGQLVLTRPSPTTVRLTSTSKGSDVYVVKFSPKPS